jgi:RNA polymerase sigma factor (sigma-70 family)
MLVNKPQLKFLIDELKSNSDIGKTVLYENYYSVFYNWALNITKNKQDAEDVLSDSFTIIFNKIYQLKNDELFFHWCKSIIRSKCLTYLKRKKITCDIEDKEIKFNEDIISKLDLQIIKKHIEKLPNGYKIIIEKRCLEDLTYNEIAKQLNINEGTVKSQLFKAKEKLKKLLNI